MGRVVYTTVTDKDMAAVLLGPDGPVVKDLVKRAIRVQNEAKRLAPVDNGTLRNSITYEVLRKNGKPLVRVGTNMKYARFVHDGTGIYGPKGRPIRPVNAKVLRWPVRGVSSSRPSTVAGRGRVVSKSSTRTGWAYAREVRGVRPTPFLRDALIKGTGRTVIS